MRRVPFASAFLVGAAGAAVVVSSAQFRTGAQRGTPSAEGRGFVGAWRVTFETPMGASQSLLTVTSDGTVLFSGRPVSPASGGNPVTFSSAGHGTWEATGETTAGMTWIGLVTAGDGTFLAVVTDSVEATLGVDGDSWSGVYSAKVADPEGNVIYVGGATVTARRIAVEPLATSVSTPTSSD